MQDLNTARAICDAAYADPLVVAYVDRQRAIAAAADPFGPTVDVPFISADEAAAVTRARNASSMVYRLENTAG